MRRFKHRHRQVQIAVAAAVLGVAVLVGVLAPLGVFDGSRTSPASFRALSGPTVSLPSGSLTPMLQQVGDRRVEAHLTLRADGSRVFAVTSHDGRYLCLTVRQASGATADTCRLRSGLRRDDVIWIRRGVSGRLSDVYGLVPDGVEAVHAGNLSATVKNNAFVLNAVPVSVTNLVLAGSGIDRAVGIGAPETATATITTSIARS
jgi:hypothetical protein